MKELSEATRLADISPNGTQLNYLLSGGRVYASAKSWARALRVPESRLLWFETGLDRIAMLKRDLAGGDLKVLYQNVPVYRWHAVAEQLRAFDREWNSSQYKSRPRKEQRELEQFYQGYDRLVSWGYDLQERALSGALSQGQSSASVSQETLIRTMKDVLAPRLHEHDNKLREHDVVIAEIKNSVPALRDLEEFITVKQGISEKGFDASEMPLYPKSRETLSGLAGQMLKDRNAEQGGAVAARLEGQSFASSVNTYKRKAVYAVLDEIISKKQRGLPLSAD